MSQGNTDVSERLAKHAEACPVREIIDRVGSKWSVQIILAVTQGPVRFTELERSIEGISRRMLTLTLRNLERDGLIIRTVYPTVPPKVEYTASEMTMELEGPLSQLARWALRHRDEVITAREVFDTGKEKEKLAS
ncbi:helix-turn-helix domain-containing protein [Streptomyces sp. AD681]|uniref:Helix-turn-helix transcriptional regulator n=1 Tax=Streptomyces rubrogriseus TaxID=194673 RepID=A0A6G3TSS5_9ACTN|nr:MULTISPECIES: helix-turn-helix domain-containing protein [Streptomyces]MDA5142606.1 helix-turn-helix domain-containing protein [Streptomyces sp. AD681]MYS70924.1 transcriptional regulator [Streptomyces sp. SID5926]NEC39780.1 helix-turn-helix transcriptional regulator [Streptomyces rubrogriseus]